MKLGDVPTTVTVTLTGCICAIGTAGLYFAATMQGVDIPEVQFGMWLGFVGAMLGVGYKWFSKKRDTYQPSPPNTADIEDVPAEEAGKAPAREPVVPMGDAVILTQPSAPVLRDAQRHEKRPESEKGE
jgi:hypothetical protein